MMLIALLMLAQTPAQDDVAPCDATPAEALVGDVHVAEAHEISLRGCRAVLRRSGDTREPLGLARGQLLRLDPNAAVSADYLRLEEEEVPRDGIELKRAFNYARDADGRALLWIGRSKTTGRGEGASGLKFDAVSRGKV